MQDSNYSCHILPLSNTYVNEGNSEYCDDDGELSVLEDDMTEDKEESSRKAKPQRFTENDPEVQNAKLLLKYAEMQGAVPSGSVTESKDADFHKRYRHEQEELSADYEIDEEVINLNS